jgi:Domain of unknown function (DUF3303)
MHDARRSRPTPKTTVESRPSKPSTLRSRVPRSILGWHVMEGDPAVIAEHVAEWADVLELEVYPVIEDDAAEAAAKKVHGK